MQKKTVIAAVDTNVVVSGIFWAGSSRRLLAAFAERKFQWAPSPAIVHEYRRTALRLRREKGLSIDPEPALHWIEHKARWFDPMNLLNPISRDPDDDKFLACALAANAGYVVALDKDLLGVGKPFGIEVLKPGEFLKRISD